MQRTVHITLVLLLSLFVVSTPASFANDDGGSQVAEDQEHHAPLLAHPRTTIEDLERWLSRDLVATVPRGKLRLGGGPRIADLLGDSLVAWDPRLNYGITDKLTGVIQLRLLTDNPLSEENAGGEGLGDLVLGTRYRLPRWQLPQLEATLSLNLSIPLTEDDNRSDGVYHVIPTVTLMRPLPFWCPLHLYTQLGIDIATDSIDRTPVANEIQESFFIVAAGLVYPLPQIMLFLDIEWNTNAAIGDGERHNVTFTPGIRYELPKVPVIPRLINIDLGFRIGVGDTLGRYDIGLRITFDPLPKKPEEPSRL